MAKDLGELAGGRRWWQRKAVDSEGAERARRLRGSVAKHKREFVWTTLLRRKTTGRVITLLAVEQYNSKRDRGVCTW